ELPTQYPVAHEAQPRSRLKMTHFCFELRYSSEQKSTSLEEMTADPKTYAGLVEAAIAGTVVAWGKEALGGLIPQFDGILSPGRRSVAHKRITSTTSLILAYKGVYRIHDG
ncbi:hypothetical protein THAOC_18834, partial [Thalassiosira oceanica]